VHFDQADYDLRCEWGLRGLLALAPGSDAVVIVDVLSFSTGVDIAVSRGASVTPWRWKDGSAKPFAAAKGAVLAEERPDVRRDGAHGYTLSPFSLLSIPAGTELVLPSPNGSTLALSAGGVPVFTACLRNAAAVARHAAALGQRIAVIPAGEQWGESELRPCLEDLIGAGSVLAELCGSRSPEAEMAIAAFARFRLNISGALFGCGSGRELVQRGFVMDVELAAECAVSSAAPLIHQGQFIDASKVVAM